jgi:hypothetical protein
MPYPPALLIMPVVTLREDSGDKTSSQAYNGSQALFIAPEDEPEAESEAESRFALYRRHAFTGKPRLGIGWKVA